MKRSLDYSDSNPENNLTTKKVLEKSTSSPNHYTDIATTILKKKVLNDWCAAYDSAYSPDNWGKLKVEKWKVE